MHMDQVIRSNICHTSIINHTSFFQERKEHEEKTVSFVLLLCLEMTVHCNREMNEKQIINVFSLFFYIWYLLDFLPNHFNMC